jgi:acetate kinase
MTPDPLILVINTGSSSLKFGLYTQRIGEETLLFEGEADNIGKPTSKLELKDAQGKTLRSEDLTVPTESAALDLAAQWLKEIAPTPAAVGHRVVHGGPHLLTHQLITPELLQELERCIHFAPLHIPVALELIRKSTQVYATQPQFACFDTAFHTTIPEQYSRFPLPAELYDEGVHRYGFHGLSYESIVHSLGAGLRPKTVVAHLGSGASLAALLHGRSQMTSMGFTPTGGIPMGTRSGDLDPGVLLYLLREKQMDPTTLESLLNHDSGLKALGGSSDMRDLQQSAEKGDPKAALAIDIFANAVRDTVAAYAAVLGGIDQLIFSGGIGEHSSLIRDKVTDGLIFLNIPEVRVVPSEEDLQIARHCRALLAGQ